jgi:hypothetical protein
VVLLAAGVVTVALVAMLLAFVQLGYHADVGARDAAVPPDEDTRRVLAGAVDRAAVRVDGRDWTNRSGAADRVDATVDAAVRNLSDVAAAEGRAMTVEQNATAAASLAADCPTGPNREFGDCEALGGVVVQERAGEVALLGVALDVRVTGHRVRSNATYLLRAG